MRAGCAGGPFGGRRDGGPWSNGKRPATDLGTSHGKIRGVMAPYAYLRKSVLRDLAADLSHEVQEQAVRELAHRHGDDGDRLTILSDWDKSGRLGPSGRPGYAGLLEAIADGRVGSLYSYSLSRLSRSLPELARLVADCDRRGIPVRLVADHVDTSTASGRLLTHVLGSVAQFESDVASERTRAAIAAKAARGAHVGGFRYGTLPGEDAEAVLAAYLEAGSFHGAARSLNARGIAPRISSTWRTSSVSAIVRERRPDLPMGRQRGVKSGPRAFALARLLVCPSCGGRLTGGIDRHRAVPVARYSCALGTARPHDRRSVSENLIMPAIKAEAARFRMLDLVEMEATDDARRAELEARRGRILDMFEAGHIDRADRERRLASLAADLESLEARRVVVKVPAIDWTWPPGTLNAVLRSYWHGIPLDDGFRPAWPADESHWRLPREYLA